MPYSQDDLQKLKLIAKKEQKTGKFSENPPGVIDANRVVQVMPDYWHTYGGRKAEPEKKAIIVTDSLLPYQASKNYYRFKKAVDALKNLFLEGFKIYVWCGKFKECVNIDDIDIFCREIEPIHSADVIEFATKIPLKRDNIAIADYFKINQLCAMQAKKTVNFNENRLSTGDFTFCGLNRKQMKKILHTFDNDLSIDIKVKSDSDFLLFSNKFNIVSCEISEDNFDFKQLSYQHLISLKTNWINLRNISRFLDKDELNLKKLFIEDKTIDGEMIKLEIFPSNAKNIEEIKSVSPICFENLPVCDLPYLKYLDLSDVTISLSQLANIFNGAISLKEINLRCYKSDEMEIKPAILPSLEKLHLSGKISYEKLKKQQLLTENTLQFFLGQNLTVKQLFLRDFYLKKDLVQEYNLAELEILSLKNITTTKEFLERFLGHSDNLHTLSMDNVISSNGFPQKKLLKITTVELYNYQTRDISIILRSTPNVSHLAIKVENPYSCDFLVNFPPLERLETLTIKEGNGIIIGENVAQILKNAPNLKSLDLSKIIYIQGDLPICDLPHLKKIELNKGIYLNQTINLLANAKLVTELKIYPNMSGVKGNELANCFLESLKKLTIESAKNSLCQLTADLVFKIIGKAHLLEEFEVCESMEGDLPACDFPYLKKLIFHKSISLNNVASLCINAKTLNEINLTTSIFYSNFIISLCDLSSLKSIIFNKSSDLKTIQSHQLENLISQSNNLVKIDLGNTVIKGELLSSLKYPQLEELYLNLPPNINNSSITGDFLFDFISSCKRLRILDLTNRKIEGKLSLCNLPELTSLKLDKTTTVTQIFNFVKNAKKLEELNVAGFTNFEGKIDACNLASLKKANFSNTEVTGNQVERFLYHSTLVEELNFNACKKLMGKWRWPKMFNLRKIDLSDTGINAKQLSELFKNSPNIEHLALGGYKSSELFRVGNLKKLRVLHLDGATMTVQQLYEILKNAPNLEELSLINFNINLNQELAALNLAHLRMVNISNSNLTAQQLGSIVRKSSSLKHLALSYCCNFKGNFPACDFFELKTIDIEGTEITGPQLGKMIAGSQKLTRLNLKDTGKLQGEVPRCSLHSLIELNVKGSNINAAQLTHLVCEAIHLKELNLEDCKNLHGYTESYRPVGCTLSSLTKINASQSTITAELLASLLFNTPAIKNLIIRKCEKIDGELQKCSLPNLMTFDFEESNLNASQIINLVSDSSLLKELCINLKKEEKFVVSQECRLYGLKHLVLKGYSRNSVEVDADSVANLLAKKPNQFWWSFPNADISNMKIAGVVNRATSVSIKQLSMNSCQLDANFLDVILQSNAQILRLDYCTLDGKIIAENINNDGLGISLQEAYLMQCHLDVSLLESFLRRRVSILDLSNCKIAGELKNVSIYLQYLQRLTLSYAEIGWENVEILLKSAKNLQRINLSGLTLDKCFSCGPFPYLEELYFSDEVTINGDLLANIINESTLKELDLRKIKISGEFPLCNLSKTVEIDFSHENSSLSYYHYKSDDLDANFLSSVLQSTFNLKSLYLAKRNIVGTLIPGSTLASLAYIQLKNSNISQENFAILLNSSPNITNISIGDLSQLEVLLQFDLGLTHLTVPNSINFVQLVSIVKKFPQLTYLTIEKGTLTNDEVVRLKEINLGLKIKGILEEKNLSYNRPSYSSSTYVLGAANLKSEVTDLTDQNHIVPAFDAKAFLEQQKKIVVPKPDFRKLEKLLNEAPTYIVEDKQEKNFQDDLSIQNILETVSDISSDQQKEQVVHLSDDNIILTPVLSKPEVSSITISENIILSPEKKATFIRKKNIIESCESINEPLECSTKNDVHLSFHSVNGNTLVDPKLYRQVYGKDKYIYQNIKSDNKNILIINSIGFDNSIDDLFVEPCALQSFERINKKSQKSSNNNYFLGKVANFDLTSEWQLLPSFSGATESLAVKTIPEVEFEVGFCKKNQRTYIRLLPNQAKVSVKLNVIVSGDIQEPLLLNKEINEDYSDLLMNLLLQNDLSKEKVASYMRLIGLEGDPASIIDRAYFIQQFLSELENKIIEFNVNKDEIIPSYIKNLLLNSDKLNEYERNALIFSRLAKALHIPNYSIVANEAGNAFIELFDEIGNIHVLSLGTEVLQFELVEDDFNSPNNASIVKDENLVDEDSPVNPQSNLPYYPLYVTWEQLDVPTVGYLEKYVKWLLDKGDSLNPGEQQVLIYCPNKKAIEDLHQAFLSVLNKRGEECLYVRKLSSIRAKGVRFENDSFNDDIDSYFQTYVKKNEQAIIPSPRKKRLLLNWSYYKASDVNKHSIVEKGKRRFNNGPIADDLVIFNFQLIDHEQKLREDFTSRMGMITQHPDVPLKLSIAPENTPQEEKINLYESPMWQMLLLGRVQINREYFQLYDGGLLTAIKEEKAGITLTNPPFHLAEFRDFWRQLMIDRTFLWNNELISLPENFKITVNNEEYNLVDLAAAKPFSGATEYDETLNSQNSYRFYQSYHIDTAKKQLATEDGILAKYKKSSLRLLVTESLSESEWARLLDNARAKECQLEITLAQGVQLPASCELPSLPSEFLSVPKNIQLFTSNDLGFSEAVLKEKDAIALSLQTNQLTLYSELIESISFTKQDKHFSFEHKLSRIMEVLLSNEKKFRNKHLLIKGELSPEIAQALSTLFAMPKPFLWVNGEKRYVQNKITFLLKVNPFVWVKNEMQVVSEKDIQERLLAEFPKSATEILEKAKTITEHFKTSFSYTRLRNIILAYEANPEKNPFSSFFRLHPESRRLLPEIKKNWPAREKKINIIPEDVLEQRLEKTARIFKSSPYIFWVGETGTGKTTAFEKLKDYYAARGITVVPFYGLAEEEKWANYKTKKNEMPIILYDEANMSESGTFDRYESLFTQKSGLMSKKGEFTSILPLKNGKIRKLSPNHKVFCAGNFSFYEDRNQHDFFDHYGHIHCFKPYPKTYLRDGFLLPIFAKLHVHLATQQKTLKIGENYTCNRHSFPDVSNLEGEDLLNQQRELFNPVMQMLINVYLFAKKHCTDVQLTPRNLQMMALRFAVLCEKVAVSDQITLETLALFSAYDEIAGFLNKEQTKAFCEQFGFGGPRIERVSTAFYEALSGVSLKNSIPQLPPTDKFFMTKSRIETWRLLRQHYDIGQLRKKYPDLKRCGTQGVFIEGGSGIGKTAIIQYLIDQQGVIQLQPNTQRIPGKTYYRDLSGTDLERIKDQLLDANEHGDIVILDEIDTLPIEEVLNCLPELEVYATGNGSAFSGRLILTPAFRNRYRCITLGDYQKGERAQIVSHFGSSIPGRKPEELEKAFIKTKNYAKEKHLRPEPVSRDFFDRTITKNRR